MERSAITISPLCLLEKLLLYATISLPFVKQYLLKRTNTRKYVIHTFLSPIYTANCLWCWAGKTYRIRVSNVGVSTSLNFRIQNHNLLLAETEGSYTVQQNYTSLDIHVGQSYSFLVTMDQNASTDYYIVASARFVNESLWQRVTGVGILHYSNSKGKASGPLPEPPNDQFDKTFSMNQARSIRFVSWFALNEQEHSCYESSLFYLVFMREFHL